MSQKHVIPTKRSARRDLRTIDVSMQTFYAKILRLHLVPLRMTHVGYIFAYMIQKTGRSPFWENTL